MVVNKSDVVSAITNTPLSLRECVAGATTGVPLSRCLDCIVVIPRKDEVFLQLKKLLELFGIKKYYTNSWGAYQCHLSMEEHKVGKRKTQRIERKHYSRKLHSAPF